ncbi:MAG: hypothetical protein ACM3Q2_13825, partial [Syntrophothermus sp.]
LPPVYKQTAAFFLNQLMPANGPRYVGIYVPIARRKKSSFAGQRFIASDLAEPIIAAMNHGASGFALFYDFLYNPIITSY